MSLQVLSIVLRLAVAGGGALLQPPVDAPIVDHFRPPACQWCAGNRGIDYFIAPGTPVRAAASGTVSFAGPVGNDQFVVVAHAGGYRTTYGYVSSVLVTAGQAVRLGEVVALSGEGLHFGLRLGSRYLDPELYLAAGWAPTRPRLRPTFVAKLGPTGAEPTSIPTGFSAGNQTPVFSTCGRPWAPETRPPSTAGRNHDCSSNHEPARRCRRAFRPSDPPLEPEDEAIHLG